MIASCFFHFKKKYDFDNKFSYMPKVKAKLWFSCIKFVLKICLGS